MNTRLLMMLRVKVGTPQNLGAVPLGTRRTAPLSGGSFEGARLRVRLSLEEARTGKFSAQMECSKWTFGSRCRRMMVRSFQ